MGSSPRGHRDSYTTERLSLTHPRILAWEIPWAEEPGGLQSTGSQRVGTRLSD